jgi:enoyl-CoA hydratase/carnithine racemase
VVAAAPLLLSPPIRRPASRCSAAWAARLRFGHRYLGLRQLLGRGDGVAYGHEIDDCMRALDAIPVTTIAVVDGWAVGGGLNIAATCDFRIATPDARFG